MGLSPEQIKALLNKPSKPRGGKRKKQVDDRQRDIVTWFALSTKTRDDLGNDLRCENPNCVDPRPAVVTALGNEVKHQFVVEINGTKICRYCFLDGYLLENPAQGVLGE